MKGYHDLDLKCHVLLLACIFENFRQNSLKNYGLCPSHYLSTPALNWDAILNMAKVELELIPDLDMYIFFEKCARGRVFYISNRYSKVNNKHSKQDPKQESKDIKYLDTNNFCGYVVSKFLPISSFKWIDLREFSLNKCTRNKSKGFVFEVDLEYPKESRVLHNDHPLTPDKIEIKRDMLSDYQLKIADFYNIHIGNVQKLVRNFFDKEKYVSL